MAVAAEVSPDWSTLAVAGPTEMADADPEARFEWTASVAVRAAATSEEPGRAIAVGSDRPPPEGSVDADAGCHLQGLSGG
jgi:hypothetical protein